MRKSANKEVKCSSYLSRQKKKLKIFIFYFYRNKVFLLKKKKFGRVSLGDVNLVVATLHIIYRIGV